MERTKPVAPIPESTTSRHLRMFHIIDEIELSWSSTNYNLACLYGTISLKTQAAE